MEVLPSQNALFVLLKCYRVLEKGRTVWGEMLYLREKMLLGSENVLFCREEQEFGWKFVLKQENWELGGGRGQNDTYFAGRKAGFCWRKCHIFG